MFGDQSFPPRDTLFSSSEQETSTKSDDPFDLYNLLNKPPATITTEPEPSLSHPPGFTPAPSHQEAQNDKSAQQDVASPGIVYSANESFSDVPESFHSRKILNGGSILDVLDDIIKVGTLMGYVMEGCSKDIEHIINTQ
uniref:RNA-directed DNA polymerase, eukaryota n=1 Tax=Tanacetum cinerariifolium TaxID=118510 RepID=A0A699HW06_TANCI|nr:hypothetical protein [Tanacetum cinerariifolium]